MSTKISPRLGRTDVMLDSFSRCIANTPEEFSRAPEMPFGEISSEPRMFLHKLKGRITLEQLQCPADRHCGGDLNKEMDVVNCNMQLIDLASMPECNFSYKSLAINSNTIELKGVHGIFGLPHKVEGILPEGMAKTLKVHFFAPPITARSKAHAKSVNLVFERDVHSHPLFYLEFIKDKFMEDGNSSLCLKAEVSLPFK